MFEGPQVLLYGSDHDDAESMRGSSLMLRVETRAQVKLLAARLGEGAAITTAPGMLAWGAFGATLTDKFGVRWTLSCEEP